MIIDVSKIHIINSKPVILPGQKEMMSFDKFIENKLTYKQRTANPNKFPTTSQGSNLIEEMFCCCGQTTFLSILSIHIILQDKKVIFADAKNNSITHIHRMFEKLLLCNNLDYSLMEKITVCHEYQVSFRVGYFAPHFIVVDNVINSISARVFNNEINFFNCPKYLEIK